MSPEGLERIPPHDRNAEAACLASMLRDNSCIGEVTAIVKPENFYTDAHQKLCRCILEMWDKGKRIDLVTLADALRDQMDDVGGYGYLGELWEAVATAANAEHYAGIVLEKSMLRGLIHSGMEMIRGAYDCAGTAEDLLADAERKIFALSVEATKPEVVDLATALGQACDEIDARQTGSKQPATATGFIDLDERMSSGLRDSELIIVAARPSHGKTAFALNVMRNVASEGGKVLFISLEQSRLEIAERLLSIEGRVEHHKMRAGRLNSDDIGRLQMAASTLANLPILIEDTPYMTFLRIAGIARRIKMRKGLDLLAIDYLQLVEAESSMGRSPRHEQVAAISRRLKGLARELKIPVVCLAQVNRAAEERTDHTPRLSDLRESGAIEQDADAVLFLHRPEMYEPGTKEGVCEVIIGKQRNGPTGQINLTFLKHFMRFENFAFDPYFEQPATTIPKPERERAY